jgi:trigger factor
MQVSIEKAEGLVSTLNVTIPAENINSKVEGKLTELSKQVKIKGFRPGKVPRNILNQRYGKHVRQDVLGELINDSIQKAVKDNDISLSESPEITETKDLDDGGFSFSAKLELIPELPEIEYSKIKINKEVSEVTDKDVEGMIAKLQKQKQEWKESKAKIAKGDLVTIEFSAKNKEIQYPESGKEKMGILLGESGVPDELVNKIIGMKNGESTDLKIDFPKVFNVKAIAGKNVDFNFDIVDHKRGKLPKVDEEFVKSFGVDSGNVDDLKSEIKDNLNRELSNVVQANVRESVLNSLRKEISDVSLPEKMIARESSALAHQTMQKAREMGIQNPDHPDHKDFEGQAKERLLNALLIGNVAKKQDIKVDYTKVREKVIEISQTFENPPQIVEYYYGNKELLASIENAVLETQVIDWIASKVELKEKTVAFDKLMNPKAS